MLELSLGAPQLLLEPLLELVKFNPGFVPHGLELFRDSVVGLANVVFEVSAHFLDPVLGLTHLLHDESL